MEAFVDVYRLARHVRFGQNEAAEGEQVQGFDTSLAADSGPGLWFEMLDFLRSIILGSWRSLRLDQGGYCGSGYLPFCTRSANDTRQYPMLAEIFSPTAATQAINRNI